MSQIFPQKPPLSPNSAPKPKFIQQRLPWLYAFWKFSRPHTIIGTTLSAVGVYLVALATEQGLTAGGSFALLPALSFQVSVLVLAIFACLCGNVYIVGLNQLEDVAIDRINKPHLPLASGEFSRLQGQWIVALTGGLALLLSALQGYFLLGTVGVSLLIGTAYSLPPLRLKRFPFWASLCIFTVRGAIVNLGLFLHFQQQLYQSSGIPVVVWALTSFILLFTFAIAIFKDIPDLEGDRHYHIHTLTIRLGQQAVFDLARWVLTACYLGMILGGFWLPSVNKIFLISSHMLALLTLWYYSFRVNFHPQYSVPSSGEQATRTLSYAQFYQLIWKLFFLEYIMFPIACLLSYVKFA
jgi:homogentisate phytyltransferase / homogentisate geranylgeranyltransferase